MSEDQQGPKKPRKPGSGRPPFRVTPALRQRVVEMSVARMTHAQMAKVIGCEVHTLTKHFRTEIDHGPTLLRDEMVALLGVAARKGNVSAQKALVTISEREAASRAIENAHADLVGPAQDVAAPSKLGKKEQRAIDAETAGIGTDWGDDLHMSIPN